jgi:hypothetical protein
MRFQNPSNGYVTEASSPGLWVLIFGCFYFLAKGVWVHFLLSAVLAVFTYGVSWLIYPLFAGTIMRKHYLSKGWLEV